MDLACAASTNNAVARNHFIWATCSPATVWNGDLRSLRASLGPRLERPRRSGDPAQADPDPSRGMARVGRRSTRPMSGGGRKRTAGAGSARRFHSLAAREAPARPSPVARRRPARLRAMCTLPGEEGRSSGWPRARSCRRVRVDSELEARRRSSAACSHQYALPAGCRLAGGPARRSRLLDFRPAGRRPGPSSALFGLFKFFRIGTVPIGLAVAVDLALHRIVWPTASTPPSV